MLMGNLPKLDVSFQGTKQNTNKKISIRIYCLSRSPGWFIQINLVSESPAQEGHGLRERDDLAE
jgi:hypothetical protein